MAAPLLDLHVRSIIDYTLKVVRSDPDKYLPDIFGDYRLDPHAALYGNKTIGQVKKWIQDTKINILYGFDIAENQLPAVTINLSNSSPSMPIIGDYSDEISSVPLQDQFRDILVEKFVPKDVQKATEGNHLLLTLPDTMPLEKQDLFMPGMVIRDALNQEYPLSADQDGKLIILPGEQPLRDMDLTGLTLVSPVLNATYRRGTAIYEDSVTIAIHGHSSRNEGLWLYYIVHWGLLKFRPILEEVFGVGLSMPSSSDFTKAAEYGGENVWQRLINLSCKTLWSWDGARQKDVLGLIMTVNNGQSG